jgi:hypothetical protein
MFNSSVIVASRFVTPEEINITFKYGQFKGRFALHTDCHQVAARWPTQQTTMLPVIDKDSQKARPRTRRTAGRAPAYLPFSNLRVTSQWLAGSASRHQGTRQAGQSNLGRRGTSPPSTAGGVPASRQIW